MGTLHRALNLVKMAITLFKPILLDFFVTIAIVNFVYIKKTNQENNEVLFCGLIINHKLEN